MALTTAPPYFTYADAVAIMGAPTMLAILDDGTTPSGETVVNSGAVNMDTFNRLANLACTRVDGFLKRVYPGPFPIVQNPIPADIQSAALLWFRAYAFERHTEYVRQYGTAPRKEAMQFCEDLVDSKEWLADLVGGQPPQNAGGIVYDHGARMICDSQTGQRRSGDF